MNGPPPAAESIDYPALTDDELAVAALHEAIHAPGRLGEPWPPAVAESMRRRRAAGLPVGFPRWMLPR